jgi:hypothetical protein
VCHGMVHATGVSGGAAGGLGLRGGERASERAPPYTGTIYSAYIRPILEGRVCTVDSESYSAYIQRGARGVMHTQGWRVHRHPSLPVCTCMLSYTVYDTTYTAQLTGRGARCHTIHTQGWRARAQQQDAAEFGQQLLDRVEYLAIPSYVDTPPCRIRRTYTVGILQGVV